jgi:uncharacterized protein (TIGR02217 family)
MSFIETRMDESVSYGFKATPTYSTQIVPLDNGKEQRNANWAHPKRHYSALFQNFTPAEFAALLATFHAVRGSAYSFRFKDWTDYMATLEALGNTPGANSTPVQLIKTYTFGAASYVRTITKPVSGTVTVYQGGVAKAGTFSTTTGLFTPTTNWTAATALTWTGEFDTPVRFVNDEMPAQYDNYNAITTSVELVEDRL